MGVQLNLEIALHDALDAGLCAHRHEYGSFDDAVRGVDAAGASAGGGALGDEFELHYFNVSAISGRDRLPYSEAMEVHFTPEQEARLAEIATTAGTDAERLVKDAALRLLQEDARFRDAVREGVAQADRGEFIEEEEMDVRLEQMLRS